MAYHIKTSSFNEDKMREYAKDIIELGPKLAYKKWHPDRSLAFCDKLARNEIKNNGRLKKTLKEELVEAGLDTTYLHICLKDLTKANKAIVVDNKIEYVNDNHARADSLKTAYKLHGLLKDNVVNVDNRQINFSGDMSKVMEVVNEMRKLNQELELSRSEGEVIDVKV